MGNTFATGAGRQIPPISEFQKIKDYLKIGMKKLKETSSEDYDELKVHFKKIFGHVDTSMNSKKNKTKLNMVIRENTLDQFVINESDYERCDWGT